MNKKIYITTTLPYVNAEPHIGFALEIIQADIFARYMRNIGNEVFFNFGTDEHGQKIYEKAKESNEDVQDYVDRYAKKFDALKKTLNLTYNNFVRTTDPHHILAAQEFWRLCDKKGDIYKKNYKIKYCIGCELEKTDSELLDGRCPIHPNKDLEIREEENYFFRFSKYAKELLEIYKNNPSFVVPETRLNEIKKFVEGGLEDFSISRLKSKMPWGIEVPGDPEHVMYVWFDALINYISAIGWPDRKDDFSKWWPVIQFAGKDNLRQQSAMWQAMLLSAGIPLSNKIFIHGFITSGGQKMSKSLGNVISPFVFAEEYGTDALRYYIAREITPFEDSDMTEERFKNAYNANLANGLGNTVSRVLKMYNSYLKDPVSVPDTLNLPQEYGEYIISLDLNKAMDIIWRKLSEIDLLIQEKQPFKLIKTNEMEAIEVVSSLVRELFVVAKMLEPFMPETSAKIQEAIINNKSITPLFLRKE